jgi:hypothetical protein
MLYLELDIQGRDCVMQADWFLRQHLFSGPIRQHWFLGQDVQGIAQE